MDLGVPTILREFLIFGVWFSKDVQPLSHPHGGNWWEFDRLDLE